MFVGHITEKEKAELDRARALNAAAVISAGKGICSNFPATQIQISAAGAAPHRLAAAHAVRNVLRILKRENSLNPTFDHVLSLEDYYELVGLKDMLGREESYDKAAAALGFISRPAS